MSREGEVQVQPVDLEQCRVYSVNLGLKICPLGSARGLQWPSAGARLFSAIGMCTKKALLYSKG